MKFHSQQELISDLESIQEVATEQFAEIFCLTDNTEQAKCAKSLGNRDLKGIRLRNKSIPDEANQLRPLVKLVGNMHGNEPTGREMLIHLAKYIVLANKMPTEDLKRDELAQRAAKLLTTTDLWLLPTMNPDGFARGKEGRCFGSNYSAGRTNENRIDLNRNFPTWKQKGQTISELKQGKEHETKLMMDWILKHPFVLSANFHDGAVLANYPYDDYRTGDARKTGGVSRTPDHDVFVHLAKTYTSNHPYMEDTSKECEHWGYFRDGITNGADWYEVAGGMQDFNYDFTNAMELTIEVSCCKYPERNRLLDEWQNNVNSLISYVEQAQLGLRGFVKDESNKPVFGADIQVQKLGEELTWRQKNVTSDLELGRYWRILMPGNYKVRAVKGNVVSEEIDVQVPNSGYKRLDFQLKFIQ